MTYYVIIANSIRDDPSYTVEWEDYSYVDDLRQALRQPESTRS